MASVRQIITQISDRLVDQEEGYEFTTWTQPQLLNAFNWSLQFIARQDKEPFTSWSRVEIPPDGIIELGADCEEVRGVGGLYDPNGNYVSDLDMITPLLSSLRRVPFCGGKDWRPGGVERYGDRSLRVWPGPQTEGYELQVRCMSVPQADDFDADVDVPTSLLSVVQELMLYYGHMYDIEAVPSRDRAAKHMEVALIGLGVGRG